MTVLRDRLLLVVSAVGLLAAMLTGLYVLSVFDLDQHLGLLWLYTVLLFLALLVGAGSEIKRRSRKLHRKWPLVIFVMMFFIAHTAVIGLLLTGPGRDWRMLHFYVVSVIEVLIFAFLFERIYARCVLLKKGVRRSF